MYDHRTIEKKWQEKWRENNIYQDGKDFSRPKFYVLDMFPYPSGQGLHVGHPKGYIATDIIARRKLMQGYNVLHPMGWDAFGLPAENYALKTKTHPRLATASNIATFKRQLGLLGLSYDWEREIDTTDPDYYRWTQWTFLQMWRRGLAYESFAPINWCPSCKTGLANEDLENGLCERCGSQVEQKPMRQWVIKITEYADRLLSDLDELPNWEEPIKDMQRNWIGRSEGVEIDFAVSGQIEKIKVFTTRVDTIFGCRYLVLAPEHPLLQKLRDKIENWGEVQNYIEASRRKTELQRTDLNKEKSGARLVGIEAVNPFNSEKIPVYVADYVLSGYGTGAVMAVPAHDERDAEFADKYDIEIVPVIACDAEQEALVGFFDDGFLRGSGVWSGMSSAAARQSMSAWLTENGHGSQRVNYKIKDWVFSRQRYWGEPIPLIHCPHCGVVPVPEDNLPVLLPEVESYEPTGTGESPLAAIDEWVNVKCPVCGVDAKRETNTMPQWGGSCWYYLRYIDPKNSSVLVDKDKEAYWSPVDLYVGGAEHATRHLIYARFWHKFLFDIGLVSRKEPFLNFRHVGLIMGEDGRKMSKRWQNVINPDDMAERFGADALRIYEMFMGPFDQAAAWNTSGLIGVRKFLDKLYRLLEENPQRVVKENRRLLSLLHKTLRKVSDDIDSFRFNTAVSAMMIFANEASDYLQSEGAWPFSAANLRSFFQVLSPFAPHLCEEIFFLLDGRGGVFASAWPQYDSELIKDENSVYVVQINGKMRAQVELPADSSQEEVIIAGRLAVAKWLDGQAVKKEIFVPQRLINFVI